MMSRELGIALPRIGTRAAAARGLLAASGRGGARRGPTTVRRRLGICTW